MRTILLLILVVLMFVVLGNAQAKGKSSQFYSFGGGPFDQLNLSNLEMSFGIPIVSKPGRGIPFTYALSYNNAIWVTGTAWSPAANWGWGTITQGSVGYLPYTVRTRNCHDPDNGGTYPITSYFFSGYIDASGVNHNLGLTLAEESPCGVAGQLVATKTLLDGSAIKVTVDATGPNPVNTIQFPDGQTIHAPSFVSDPGSAIDANGNQITATSTTFTDTLGTTALTIAGTNPKTYTYSKTPSGTAAVTVNYTTKTVRTNFGCSGISEYGPISNSLVSSIVLPDGTSYSFTYEATPGFSGNVTGRLASVTLPTGGIIQYTYTNSNPALSGASGGIVCATGQTAGLVRTLKPNSTTTEGAWTYDRSGSNPGWITTISDPQSNQTKIFFQGLYPTEQDAYQGSVASGTLLASSQTCYNGNFTNCSTTAVDQLNPVTRRTMTANLNGWFNKTDIQYNANTLPTETDEYDFGSGGPPATPLRKTLVTYSTVANIYGKPTDIQIQDGNGTPVAETQYEYDNYTGQNPLAPTSGVPQHDYTNYGSGFTLRGNPTAVKRWVNPGNTWLITTNSFNDLGNLTSTEDPGNHNTGFDYTDNYSDGINHNTQAFVTTVTYPNTGVAHTESAKYFYPAGVVQQRTDQNSQNTVFAYDNMFRPSSVSYADGGQTTYTYPTSVRVQVQQKIDATNSTTLLTEVDGLGRPSRRAFANAETTPYDQVDTCRDSRGLVSFVSYAYQGTGLSAAKVCSGAGDSYAYDAMGRPTTVTHADGTTATNSYSGRATKVQDEGNGATQVAHIYQSDGLGRTLSVCEVSSVTLFGQTGAPPSCGMDISGTGYLTNYQYDTLGNVTQVTQGSLNPRTFVYDSLSRLSSSTTPEANVTTYTYDSEGKLYQRQRPKQNQTNVNVKVTTTYTYDNLHRVTSTSYDDGSTPTTSFAYDESSYSGKTLLYPVGRLTHAIVGTSTAIDILSYDKVGRIANDWQCSPYNCGTSSWQLTYVYNPGGLPTSATNGVGTTFSYAYNAAGRLTTLTSSLSDANHPATLLSGLHYNAFVEGTQDSLGNGVNETVGFDTRGRLTAISAVKNTTTVYSLKGPASGNTQIQYAADDNVSGTIDSANGTWNYAYDTLNRISTAGALSFDIDRNANRWHQNPNGTQISFDPATNRIASGNGVSYDAAGNITNDGQHSYTYDAEGRIVSVDASSITYAYDAYGRRVRKVVSGAAKDYVNDGAGHAIAEVVAGAWQRAEIYVGGRHLATYSGGVGGTTSFSHSDWLGTERIRTNVSGVVSETCTSNPYGDGLSCTGTDVSPIHYTGLERDTETGLDHAWFRYYNSRLGVWMTPDPAGLGAVSVENPQSWNTNAYVMNSPTNGSDSLGLMGPCGSDATGCKRSKWYTWIDIWGIKTVTKDSFSPTAVPPGQIEVKVSWGDQVLSNHTTDVPGSFWGTTITTISQELVWLGGFSVSGPSGANNGLLSKLKRLIPSVCSKGGFAYAGTEFDIGIAKGESLAVVAYDSATGGEHGGILAGGIGHYTGGIESVRTWSDWQAHTSPIGFVNGASPLVPTNLGPLKVSEANYGGLAQYQNGQLSIGGYLGGANKETGRGAGGGGYITLSWSGCHN